MSSYQRLKDEDSREGNGGGMKDTYSFGRYLGVDSKPHIGIELDPLVVPVDQKSLRGNGTVEKSGSGWV